MTFYKFLRLFDHDLNILFYCVLKFLLFTSETSLQKRNEYYPLFNSYVLL